MDKTNKKERRRYRHERNKQKDIDSKKQAWESGKLITENHNNYSYSEDYTKQLSERLMSYLEQEYNYSISSNDPGANFVRGFRKYRTKIRDLILFWNSNISENNIYDYLKGLLEIYWDEVISKQNIDSLLEYTKNYDKF